MYSMADKPLLTGDMVGVIPGVIQPSLDIDDNLMDGGLYLPSIEATRGSNISEVDNS